jgi:sensor histidine kinase regulating citrate/malate metabolism
VSLTLPDGGYDMTVDAQWLRAALAELLSQALRCARREVSVELSGSSDITELRIRDDGPVTREDGSPATPTSGLRERPRRDSGFSLFLANEVVRAHGGELTWCILEPLGLCAVSEFPSRCHASPEGEDG